MKRSGVRFPIGPQPSPAGTACGTFLFRLKRLSCSWREARPIGVRALENRLQPVGFLIPEVTLPLYGGQMGNHEMIIKAIQERLLLSFDYEGLTRLVQPAAYGTTTDGRPSLRACQIGGASSSGTLPAWRLFKVSRMQNMAFSGVGGFSSFALPGYRRGDKALRVVFAEI